MSLLDRMKTHSERGRWTGRHPIVSSLSADRNQRDAYLYGLVLGAIVDDKHVDRSEEALLVKVGCALGYSKGELEEVIASVLSYDESARLALLEEVIGALRATVLDKYFVAEFSYIWMSHGGNEDLLIEWRDQLAKRLNARFDPKLFAALDRLTKTLSEDLSELECLANGFSLDFLGYLFDEKYPGGFLWIIDNARNVELNNKRAAAEKTKRKQADADAMAKRKAESFYDTARKLVKGSLCGRNDIEALGIVSIRVEDLENIRRQLGDFTSIDPVVAIDVVARKHQERIASILENAVSNPGYLCGSISGMRRNRLIAERRLLVRIVACLVSVIGCITPKSCSALSRLMASSMLGAEKVESVDDERMFWNGNVKPVLQMFFKRKD